MDYLKTLLSSSRRLQAAVVLGTVVAMLASLLTVYLAGCTDTLKGDVYDNQKPIVYFINIPPEGQRFSINPVVYWYGTDPDGLIDFYRYMVVKDVDMNGMTPGDYVLAVHDSEWIYVDIDPRDADQKTENAIPLAADMNDPVNRFVAQWVFLQAFDMEGLGSDIAFRLFSRNDHPPDTRILDFSPYRPFVDGLPGGVVTGVKLSWLGTDPIDYPGESPPFDFHWRLYGPYVDTIFRQVTGNFVCEICLDHRGDRYAFGDTIIRCDTTFGDSVTVTCDTVECSDSLSVPWVSTAWFFDVENPDFVQEPLYNAVADSSFNGVDRWVTNTTDTIYDVYRHDPDPPAIDTTKEKWFIFWVRSRDDAFVPDLTPAFDSFTVISPRYERDVGVIDFTSYASLAPNVPLSETRIKRYWKSAIEGWNPNVEFDTVPISTSGTWEKSFTPDYVPVKKVGSLLGRIPISFMLKHKVLVLYDDAIAAAEFPGYSSNIYKSIDAGVNVLAIWRAPLVAGLQEEPNWEVVASTNYQRYFGVSQMVYSSWFCHAFPSCGEPGSQTECIDYAGRIEDFVGAYAIDSVNWPNVEVDSALLRNRFKWGPTCGLRFRIPALPEVNWSIRTPQTEVLYLYKSYYGPDHPFGGNYNMEGNPVAHRLSTFLYRTAHFNFTPLAIDSVQMQQVMNKLLTWLYPADLGGATAAVRYPDAGYGLSLSEARREYWKRCEEEAKSEHFRELDYGKFMRMK